MTRWRGLPPGVAGLDDNSLFDNVFLRRKKDNFKAVMVFPPKNANDCLPITMNSICYNFVLKLGSYTKKKEDKNTLGATGRRSEIVTLLHKSNIVILQALI